MRSCPARPRPPRTRRFWRHCPPRAPGFETIDFTDRYAAIKIHFGELGNLAICPKDAIEPSSANSTAILAQKIAEYSYAVVKGRPSFHISLICDVSPFCDCHAENDIPIIPDVGMLASFDPVALDQACADLCNKMPVIEGSRLDQHIRSFGAEDPNHDYFHLNHPDTEWEAGLIHAEEIGLGSRQYELVQI